MDKEITNYEVRSTKGGMLDEKEIYDDVNLCSWSDRKVSIACEIHDIIMRELKFKHFEEYLKLTGLEASYIEIKNKEFFVERFLKLNAEMQHKPSFLAYPYNWEHNDINAYEHIKKEFEKLSKEEVKTYKKAIEKCGDVDDFIGAYFDEDYDIAYKTSWEEAEKWNNELWETREKYYNKCMADYRKDKPGVRANVYMRKWARDHFCVKYLRHYFNQDWMFPADTIC